MHQIIDEDPYKDDPFAQAAIDDRKGAWEVQRTDEIEIEQFIPGKDLTAKAVLLTKEHYQSRFPEKFVGTQIDACLVLFDGDKYLVLPAQLTESGGPDILGRRAIGFEFDLPIYRDLADS